MTEYCETEVKAILQYFTIEAPQKLAPSRRAPPKRIIVIAGPTGSGKSALAVKLAKAIDGEVVSADSMQVYRGMNIGTAKVTLDERHEAAHHLIDIRDVQEGFNVVDFYFEARQACQQIIERGHVPIVAGGSGFYLHALLYGPPNSPPSVPELRRALELEIEQLGSEALYKRLVQLDPIYAQSITKNDKQKIVRALEIITLTHQRVSQHAWRGRRKIPHYDFRCWFLHLPKEKLNKRLEKRCDQMLKAGFLNEVKQLEEMGIRRNTSAAQAIGYRQALDYLQTAQTPVDYEHFVKTFKQATRQYAKRQLTWFRKEPLFRWIDVDAHDPEVVFDIIKSDYEAL